MLGASESWTRLKDTRLGGEGCLNPMCFSFIVELPSLSVNTRPKRVSLSVALLLLPAVLHGFFHQLCFPLAIKIILSRHISGPGRLQGKGDHIVNICFAQGNAWSLHLVDMVVSLKGKWCFAWRYSNVWAFPHLAVLLAAVKAVLPLLDPAPYSPTSFFAVCVDQISVSWKKNSNKRLGKNKI